MLICCITVPLNFAYCFCLYQLCQLQLLGSLGDKSGADIPEDEAQ